MVLHDRVLIPLLHLKSVFGTPLCVYKKEHVTAEYCSVVQDDTTTGKSPKLGFLWYISLSSWHPTKATQIDFYGLLLRIAHAAFSFQLYCRGR